MLPNFNARTVPLGGNPPTDSPSLILRDLDMAGNEKVFLKKNMSIRLTHYGTMT
jgi:hypothetical protein